MNELSQKRCQPCEGKGTPFDSTQAAQYLQKISSWQLTEDAKTIFRNFKTKNFEF